MQKELLLENVSIGIFLKELGNRFLCEVYVGESIEKCYVPSSCRLDNFIDLVGREVLLVPTKSSTATTKYTVVAVHFKQNYIVLNSSYANRIIENSMASRSFSYLGKRKTVVREKTIENYKCDLFIEETNTLIEIKSIISEKEQGLFPTVYSKRAIKQLQIIIDLLDKDYSAVLIIVALNPYMKSILLNTDTEFYGYLIEGINKGMKLYAYSSRIKGGDILLNKRISIEQ